MSIIHMVSFGNAITILILSSISPLSIYMVISSSLSIASANNRHSYQNCSQLGSYIDCSGRQLTKVSEDVPSWVEILKLNKNNLTEIPLFPPNNNITTLNLSHNHISSISKIALERLNNLSILELNYNDLKEINANDFPKLGKLKEVKINRNKLTTLGGFKQLNSLLHLELNKNQLTKISGLVFQGLESLLTLKLRQNNIEDLADGAFYGLFKLQELHLDSNKLVTVSQGWLYGLEALNFLNVSYNKINSLTNGWESCSHLKDLDISNNKLESIPNGTFKLLTNLAVLRLENNRISYIEEGAFESLHSLQVLDLSNNFISWIVENTDGAFVSLERLSILSLSYNKIFHISKDAFSGLTNLNQLDLSGNPIASIKENAFHSMPHLKELLINSSSLICDCTIGWFHSWLNETSVHVKRESLRCVLPPKLKKKLFHQLSAADFDCLHNDNPLPQITMHPEANKVTVVGNNVTLRCGANSSVDSNMVFTWKMNNHRLDNVVTKRYESVQNDGVTQFSDLFLPTVTRANTGTYQCIVSNSYGVAYSKPSQLSVYVFPVFLKTPSNITAVVGAAARLECWADGYPIPKISWHKDGGSYIPAARDRRMKIMGAAYPYERQPEPFFITNVRLEDEGVYMCQAENDAGYISWNASLRVLEAPGFTKPMKDKEVHYGEVAVLECLSSGSPKPKITWTKNNKSILFTKRHHLSALNQLLVITDAVFDDTGLYECEISNDLGAERGKSELKVLPAGRCYSVETAEINYQDTIGIAITTLVTSVVITSAVWVAFIHLTRKRNRRCIRTPLSPIDIKSENSSHSSKDSGTGDSTKRSYQDLLLTTNNVNHGSIMDNHSESPSPVPESTLPLLTTFHPITLDGSPYMKENTFSKTKHNLSMTPVHYQNKQQLDHGIFCTSPTSSSGVQCACLTATLKKTSDVCECLASNSPIKHQCIVNHCGVADHEVSCYGDVGKRPCSIPVPFHAAHSVTSNCCRHHPNSYLCLYMPSSQHNIPQ